MGRRNFLQYLETLELLYEYLLVLVLLADLVTGAYYNIPNSQNLGKGKKPNKQKNGEKPIIG